MPGPDIPTGERWWLLPVAVLAAGLLLSVPFWCSDLDVRVALWVRAWNEARGGAEQDRWWWQLAYYLPITLAGGLVLGSIAAMVRGQWRAGLYIILVLALGCGLLVNLVLKDHAGRPRPRDTVPLGGAQAYRPPWDLDPGARGKSFPSGHVAVPPLGIALWLLWRRRRPSLARWCLSGGLAATAWVGAVRMLAQGHWLSDVMWSLVLMTVVAAVLHRVVMDRPTAQAPPAAA